MHIIVLMDIIYIYMYVVADHVDLIFVFVSGSDKCEFI
jgi:hypothetical protein